MYYQKYDWKQPNYAHTHLLPITLVTYSRRLAAGSVNNDRKDLTLGKIAVLWYNLGYRSYAMLQHSVHGKVTMRDLTSA